MPPEFGTSGLRGLVEDLNPRLVQDYVRAFVRSCDVGNGLFVGRDLRASSPELAQIVTSTAASEGLHVVDCGSLPTPALALAAIEARSGAIMVTGSHIPDDRNGLKFFTSAGEITKEQEGLILTALGGEPGSDLGTITLSERPVVQYIERYLAAFTGSLSGLRIGVWQHSSVARDLLVTVLEGCGADVITFGRSDVFIPVDTEAVSSSTRRQLAAWVREFRLDALVSTDGDADRPLVADREGSIVSGDVLGAITARALRADCVVTTVSANSCIEQLGLFTVERVRIGSPYVIAGMKSQGHRRVVGYEPNGGFFLGFTAWTKNGPIAPLTTRDSILPILVTLADARRRKHSLAKLVSMLPARFTSSDRIQGVDTAATMRFLQVLQSEPAQFLKSVGLGSPKYIDRTDGWRVCDHSGDILHLRPSGNAPEFRIYSEASTKERADEILLSARELLQEYLLAPTIAARIR